MIRVHSADAFTHRIYDKGERQIRMNRLEEVRCNVNRECTARTAELNDQQNNRYRFTDVAECRHQRINKEGENQARDAACKYEFCGMVALDRKSVV